jgi:hypothetical protein
LSIKELDGHVQEGCKMKCPHNCGMFFVSKLEAEIHLKEECINTELACLGFKGCKNKDKRGLMLIHQEFCENAKVIFELGKKESSGKKFFIFLNIFFI